MTGKIGAVGATVGAAGIAKMLLPAAIRTVHAAERLPVASKDLWIPQRIESQTAAAARRRAAGSPQQE